MFGRKERELCSKGFFLLNFNLTASFSFSRRRRMLFIAAAVAVGLAALSPPKAAVGTYLSDVPTPALVADADALRERLPGGNDDALLTASGETLLELLKGLVYVHARVVGVSTREERQLYHRDASYQLATLDCALPEHGGYLCMGLNNDYDASYYWARAAGAATRLPVPGVGLRRAGDEVPSCAIHRLGEAAAQVRRKTCFCLFLNVAHPFLPYLTNEFLR